MYRVVSESCYDMIHAKKIRDNSQAGSIETGHTGRYLVVFEITKTLAEAIKIKNNYNVNTFVQQINE